MLSRLLDALISSQVIKLHKSGEIKSKIPKECPSGVPKGMFKIMRALLKRDPNKRISISTLYYRLFDEINLVESPTVVMKRAIVITP